jgi:hypothetical protein
MRLSYFADGYSFCAGYTGFKFWSKRPKQILSLEEFQMSQKIDPKIWLDAVDAQWNAHNLDAVTAFFTDDAVVRFVPPLPGAPDPIVGKAQIRTVIGSLLPGFHVKSSDHQMNDNQVNWQATASNDAFRGLGLNSVSGSGEAVLDGDKIKSFTIEFTQETVAQLQSAMAVA